MAEAVPLTKRIALCAMVYIRIECLKFWPFSPQNATAKLTWGFAPGYKIAGLQPAKRSSKRVRSELRPGGGPLRRGFLRTAEAVPLTKRMR
jgi:hypothetical protein